MAKKKYPVNTLKKGFTCEIIDVDSYKIQKDKELFEFVRNSMLEIFPTINGSYSSDSIEFAENFSTVLCTGLSKYMKRFKEDLIKEVTENIMQQQTTK